MPGAEDWRVLSLRTLQGETVCDVKLKVSRLVAQDPRTLEIGRYGEELWMLNGRPPESCYSVNDVSRLSEPFNTGPDKAYLL